MNLYHFPYSVFVAGSTVSSFFAVVVVGVVVDTVVDPAAALSADFSSFFATFLFTITTINFFSSKL